MAKAKNARPAEQGEPQTEVQTDASTQTDANASGGDAPTTEAPKTTKSIVPSKYAGKYKDGGSDELAVFIKAQSKDEKGEFQFPKFFELCRKNGLDEAKVTHYEGQVADKRNGSQGRARMTLRNMLATIARKNGKLVGLDGEEHAINLPKQALGGAAKAQADAKTQEGAGASA